MLSGLLFSQSPILYIILFPAAFAIWCLLRHSSKPRDLREPVSIRPRIPIIGHAIALFRNGSDYYEKIRYYASSHETCNECAPC